MTNVDASPDSRPFLGTLGWDHWFHDRMKTIHQRRRNACLTPSTFEICEPAFSCLDEFCISLCTGLVGASPPCILSSHIVPGGCEQSQLKFEVRFKTFQCLLQLKCYLKLRKVYGGSRSESDH